MCKYYQSDKKKMLHYKKGSNFIDVFQSLLSRFVVACSRPMKQWNDWKKAVPYAIWRFCHCSPRMLLRKRVCWVEEKMGVSLSMSVTDALAKPWRIWWTFHRHIFGYLPSKLSSKGTRWMGRKPHYEMWACWRLVLCVSRLGSLPNITVHIHLATLNGVTKADNIITKEVDQ